MAPRLPFDRTRLAMNKSLSLSALLLLSALPAYAAPEIPPQPGPREFLQDYANVVKPQHEEAIRKLQETGFERHDTPIFVVTVDSMGKYGQGGSSIARLAQSWFDKWQIGKRGTEGELINKGILLLVSIGDRESRIELGAEWGRAHDAHCLKITRSVMIPRFKKGDYSGGLHAAVVELSKMARMSAEAEGLPAIEETRQPSEKRLESKIVDKMMQASLGVDVRKNPTGRQITDFVLVILTPLLFLAAALLDAFFKGRFSAACKLAGGGLFALALILGGIPFLMTGLPMALTSHALLGKKWYLWWAGVVGAFVCLLLFVEDRGTVGIITMLTLGLAGIPWAFFYVIKLFAFAWFCCTKQSLAVGPMALLYRGRPGGLGGFLESAGSGGGGGGSGSGGFSGGGGASGSW